MAMAKGLGGKKFFRSNLRQSRIRNNSEDGGGTGRRYRKLV
jgi:hypothetical protein